MVDNRCTAFQMATKKGPGNALDPFLSQCSPFDQKATWKPAR